MLRRLQAKKPVTCKRCGFKSDAENMEHNTELKATLCKDREGCTLRVLRKKLVGA